MSRIIFLVLLISSTWSLEGFASKRFLFVMFFFQWNLFLIDIFWKFINPSFNSLTENWPHFLPSLFLSSLFFVEFFLFFVIFSSFIYCVVIIFSYLLNRIKIKEISFFYVKRSLHSFQLSSFFSFPSWRQVQSSLWLSPSLVISPYFTLYIPSSFPFALSLSIIPSLSLSIYNIFIYMYIYIYIIFFSLYIVYLSIYIIFFSIYIYISLSSAFPPPFRFLFLSPSLYLISFYFFNNAIVNSHLYIFFLFHFSCQFFFPLYMYTESLLPCFSLCALNDFIFLFF